MLDFFPLNKFLPSHVEGLDASLLAEKHLNSSGIITEKHREKAKILSERRPRPYRKR